MFKSGLPVIFLLLLYLTSSDAGYSARCGKPPELDIQWSRELSNSLLVSAPLITDVDADGQPDVVVATFDGDVHVIEGSDGVPKAGSQWPARIPHSTVHASPLQVDINGDGMLDILVTTSQGQIIFLDHNGNQIYEKQYQIQKLPVLREWYTFSEGEALMDYSLIQQFVIVDSLTLSETSTESYTMVDPHVLATPVLTDLNRDDRVEELILPVSYYFEADHYARHPDELQNMKMDLSDLPHYLASCLLIVNITTMEQIKLIPLELTQTEAASPGYVIFTPTVIDLDSKHSNLEIIVGTSSGRVHAFSWLGITRAGFPVTMPGSVQGQILVDDVNQDGSLYIVAVDTGGNINCYDRNGVALWKQKMDNGAGTAGVRLGDLDGDGKLELVLVTADGYIVAVSGSHGTLLVGWPVRIDHVQHAPPLITWLLGMDATTVVVLDERGHLHLLTDGATCKHTIPIRESSHVSIVSHQLISSKPGLQYVVATQDGTILCLSQSQAGRTNVAYDMGADSLKLMAWPAETSSHNNLAYMPHQRGVVIHGLSMSTVELSNSGFSLRFSIMHVDNPSPAPYAIKVYLGNEVMADEMYETGGTYTLVLKGPDHPTTGHLTVFCYNKHGHLSSHTIPVELHQSAVRSVQWVLFGPVVGMGVLLLLLHGFPEADLLPTINRAR